ncbi:MAG: hypothetical protein KJ899_15460 [Gammaproteobacteria bacterium]|nr:hypothetical protein [Gammaproteobacteria bacterium]
MIKVIDLYSGNPRDFDEALSGQFAGVIFKAGQGDWLDVPTERPDWWKIAGDKGLLRGWYWVCDSRYHSSKHIDAIKHWRDDWKIDLNAELGFWSDVEYPYFSMTYDQYWATPYAGHRNVVDFHYLLSVNGIDAGFYSADGVYNDIMKGASAADHDYLAGFRMWPANYPYIYIPGISKPRMFGHWKTWTFWQYHGNPDYNDFNGTEEEFYAMFGGEPIPPEPPPGENMNKVTVVWPNGASVRTAPIVSDATYVRLLAKGAVVETPYDEQTDAAGNRYIRISETPKEYIFTYYGGTLRATVEQVTPPLPGVLPTIRMHAEGYPDVEWKPL